jgi:hypothetical protein
MSDLVSVLVGVVVGGVITWFFAKRYYQAAAEDLERVSNRLSNEALDILGDVRLLMRGLEANNIVQFNRDENGKAIGVVVKFSIRDYGESRDTAELTVVPSKQETSDA